MKPQVKALLDEHKSPTYVARADVTSQLQPLLAMTTSLQSQIAAYRARLLAIELDDPDAEAFTEKVHQTLGALQKDVEDELRISRRMALGMTQLDRYLLEIEQGQDA